MTRTATAAQLHLIATLADEIHTAAESAEESAVADEVRETLAGRGYTVTGARSAIRILIAYRRSMIPTDEQFAQSADVRVSV